MDGKTKIVVFIVMMICIFAIVVMDIARENRIEAKVEIRIRNEAIENGAAYYHEAGTARSFFWINRIEIERRIRNEAVENGAAEYYLDDKNDKQFRWLKSKGDK